MAAERRESALDGARAEIDAVDRQMAALFVRRMEAVAALAACKAQRGIPIEDQARERDVLERNGALVEEEIRPYFLRFMESLMEESKRYQLQLVGE